jgi:hypothetical protein
MLRAELPVSKMSAAMPLPHAQFVPKLTG